MSRFKAGDVVVLNGHRVTVEEVAPAGPDEWVFLDAGHASPVRSVLAEWLPDPEPREEPEWQQYDVVQDANGVVFQRTSIGQWRGFGGGLQFFDHGYPARPLARLVPEGTAEEPDDHRDEWDTFGTKRGRVMAESGDADEVPALTPGMTVKHRDGRFGVYRDAVDDDGALWTPLEEVGPQCITWWVNRANLLPVTLVEKPDRQAAVGRLMPVETTSGVCLGAVGAIRAYDALFPPDQP